MKKAISIVQAKQYQAQLSSVKEKIEEASEALKSARAKGDLSENADYDAAKKELSSLKLEENKLTELLKADVEPYNHSAIISNGAIVSVSCSELYNGEIQSYLLAVDGTIMFSKVLSLDSALGKAINGNVSGTYTVNGHVYTVKKELNPDLDSFFKSIKEPTVLPL